MKTLGYYNGEIDELDRIRIPMLDRACYFGDGVYDVAFSRNYRIYALEEHVERFFNSAALLRITSPIDREGLCKLLGDLLNRMDDGNQSVYFQLSRGTAPRTHAFPENSTANLWVMIKPAEIRDVYQPMRCITLEDTRFYHCNIKTINLLPNVMATQKVVEAGVDEAIFHRGETVTECAHSNVSILKAGTLITHPTNNLILPGIARAHLLRFCEKLTIRVEERPFTLSELFDADEILITSTSALCMRVVEIDGKPVGVRDGDTVKRLQDALLGDFLSNTKIQNESI